MGKIGTGNGKALLLSLFWKWGAGAQSKLRRNLCSVKHFLSGQDQFSILDAFRES